MKRMVLFLLLVPMAFAAWQSVAALAMGISLTILTILFMVGFGFGIDSLKMMAKEEFFQLIALGVLMVALIGTDSILNAISTNEAFIEGSATTMQETAGNILDSSLTNMTTVMNNIGTYDMNASLEASKASQCSISGMGYTVSSCGGYTMLAAPISMAGGIAGFAIGELSAMKKLVEVSDAYALSLLLPVGIVLRTLKITRGAGGLLIALGISMHIMLPAGVIFNAMLAATFAADTTASSGYPAAPAIITIAECKPEQTALVVGESNEDRAVKAFTDLRSNLKTYLFQVMIMATLGPVISLLMLAGSIRALTSLAGAEVDVSAISRFM